MVNNYTVYDEPLVKKILNTLNIDKKRIKLVHSSNPATGPQPHIGILFDELPSSELSDYEKQNIINNEDNPQKVINKRKRNLEERANNMRNDRQTIISFIKELANKSDSNYYVHGFGHIHTSEPNKELFAIEIRE